MTYRIRDAAQADLSSLAFILKSSFWNEDAVGRFMHPDRESYPQDVQRYWYRRLRASWWDPSHRLVVAENAEGLAVGIADWVRMGPGTGKGLGWSWTLRCRFSTIFARIINRSATIIHPNRAANSVNITAYERAIPFFKHHWTGSRADVWNLDVLGVDPNHQKQGQGRYLVAWGLEQAAREGIAASVVSSAGNEQFYMNCGFEVVVGNVTEGEGNPLSGVHGGAIFFRDSRATAGSFMRLEISAMEDSEQSFVDSEPSVVTESIC